MISQLALPKLRRFLGFRFSSVEAWGEGRLHREERLLLSPTKDRSMPQRHLAQVLAAFAERFRPGNTSAREAFPPRQGQSNRAAAIKRESHHERESKEKGDGDERQRDRRDSGGRGDRGGRRRQRTVRREKGQRRMTGKREEEEAGRRERRLLRSANADDRDSMDQSVAPDGIWKAGAAHRKTTPQPSQLHTGSMRPFSPADVAAFATLLPYGYEICCAESSGLSKRGVLNRAVHCSLDIGVWPGGSRVGTPTIFTRTGTTCSVGTRGSFVGRWVVA
eukprot:1688568-Rhodomonas_salina.2